MWISENDLILNTIILAFQFCYFIFGVTIVIAYDLTYLSVFIDIATQIKLLRYKIGRISVTFTSKQKVENLKAIYSCIEHHQLLL